MTPYQKPSKQRNPPEHNKAQQRINYRLCSLKNYKYQIQTSPTLDDQVRQTNPEVYALEHHYPHDNSKSKPPDNKMQYI